MLRSDLVVPILEVLRSDQGRLWAFEEATKCTFVNEFDIEMSNLT